MSLFYQLDPPWMERVMELCDTVLAKAAIEHPENEMLLARLLSTDSAEEVSVSEFTPLQGTLFETQSLALLPSKKPARSVIAARWQATGT